MQIGPLWEGEHLLGLTWSWRVALPRRRMSRSCTLIQSCMKRTAGGPALANIRLASWSSALSPLSVCIVKVLISRPEGIFGLNMQPCTGRTDQVSPAIHFLSVKDRMLTQPFPQHSDQQLLALTAI